MPIPGSISELSQTAGSNYPSGSESPTGTDDYFRTYASYIAMHRDGKGYSSEVDVASAATCDIGGANSFYVRITGTTTITSLGTNYTAHRLIRFADSLVLTHNASSLILSGGADVTTEAGDTCTAIPISGGWYVADYRRAADSAGVPPGTVIHVAMNTAPTGYLKANGAAVSRTTYAKLYGAIGNTFGAGDGSTTFNLPDLRGEFLRALDDGRGVDSGRALGSAQSSQNLSHTHTQDSHTHNIDYSNSDVVNAGGDGFARAVISESSSSFMSTAQPAIQSSGGTEARPRNIALLACIKY